MLAKVGTVTNVEEFGMVQMGVTITEMARGVAIMEILEIQHMVKENIVGLINHHTHHVAQAQLVILDRAVIVHLYVKLLTLSFTHFLQ